MDFIEIDKTSGCFPEKLKIIPNAPEKLYAVGNINLLNENMIAIVGSRKISKYGIKWCEYFSEEIACRAIPIISGMALGTDTLAHKIALKYNCPTIAVLGTGLNNIYPEENLSLFYEIIEHGGLVITERAPEVKYNPNEVALRNRIISGLSDCVLVIEAGFRSGTSYTVNYAKNQGREVFVVPGRLDDKKSLWANKFIKQGAKLITEIEDITNSYPQFMNKKRITITETKVKSEYQEIYDSIVNGKNSLEELSKNIKTMNIREIANLITIMELEDIIEKDFGNGYKIKEDYA